MLNEYFIYGGYPRIALEPNKDKKQTLLAEIYNDYIQKDIVNFLKIELPDKFNDLIKILANQSGNLVNYQELSNTLGINHATVKKYINILENTFVISLIKPLYSNIRKELSKMPKLYFNDLGLRNSTLQNFESIEKRMDAGIIAENFIANELSSGLNKDNIKFWRTKIGAEMDFAIKQKNKPEALTGIEVKYQNLTRPIKTKSISSFRKTYQPKQIIIINKNLFNIKHKDNTKIIHLPTHYPLPLNEIASRANIIKK